MGVSLLNKISLCTSTHPLVAHSTLGATGEQGSHSLVAHRKPCPWSTRLRLPPSPATPESRQVSSPGEPVPLSLIPKREFHVPALTAAAAPGLRHSVSRLVYMLPISFAQEAEFSWKENIVCTHVISGCPVPKPSWSILDTQYLLNERPLKCYGLCPMLFVANLRKVSWNSLLLISFY